jgi:hypothetical protein
MLWILNEIFDRAKVVRNEGALLCESTYEVLATARGE